MAAHTLSEALNHANPRDHTADDFAVGQRVKAHPATDTFMRGDVYGTIDLISRGPKRLVHVNRSGRRRRFAARNLLHADE